MEFILNKVEPAVRQKVNSQTKEELVHTKEGIIINKDKYQQEEGKKQKSFNSQEIKKYNKSKKIVIDAVKVDTVSVEAMNEEEKVKGKKGLFLDVRK